MERPPIEQLREDAETLKSAGKGWLVHMSRAIAVCDYALHLESQRDQLGARVRELEAESGRLRGEAKSLENRVRGWHE